MPGWREEGGGEGTDSSDGHIQQNTRRIKIDICGIFFVVFVVHNGMRNSLSCIWKEITMFA